MTAAVTTGVTVARSVHAVKEHVEQKGGCNSQPHQYVSRQVQGDVVRSARLAQLDDRKMQKKTHSVADSHFFAHQKIMQGNYVANWKIIGLFSANHQTMLVGAGI